MAIVARKFASLADLNAYLGGRLRGSTNLMRSGESLYLHGLTLIFTTPAETVTFAATPAVAQVPLTIQEVKTQIEAQTTGVVVGFVNGALELYMSTPGAIGIDKDGTANALLGFDNSADRAATPVSEPGGAAPAFVALSPESGSNSYILTTEDA